MAKVVLLSGHIGSGKTELARELHRRFSFQVIKTSELVREAARRRRLSKDRKTLQDLGTRLDNSTGGAWVLEGYRALAKKSAKNDRIVIDCVRVPEQINHFRATLGHDVLHVHLDANIATLRKRFRHRRSAHDKHISFREAISHPTESRMHELKKDADLVIDTVKTDGPDCSILIGSKLGLFAPPDRRCVDVIVGGQYGSEGKGHVAAYLARSYDVLVRVGGPNAGHSVKSRSGVHVYHHLPSGCKDHVRAEVLIGPGAVIHVRKLLREIRECRLKPGQVFIDPQAMAIAPKDIRAERELQQEIGSTKQGVGSASSRKILHRGKRTVRLARHCRSLRKYLGPTHERLERAYSERKSILLEGTQGSGLSLHHGSYPHVTSRDTSVAGCLAEAGISPSRVRRILVVVRTYPIRVASPKHKGKTSGALKREISFDEVARRSGLDATKLKRAEKTSTTRRDRRVGEFDWELLRRSCELNAPTDIVLTFVDYMDRSNLEARRYEQLSVATRSFIEQLERVAHAPVSLINTRFDERSIIDRRNWD